MSDSASLQTVSLSSQQSDASTPERMASDVTLARVVHVPATDFTGGRVQRRVQLRRLGDYSDGKLTVLTSAAVVFFQFCFIGVKLGATILWGIPPLLTDFVIQQHLNIASGNGSNTTQAALALAACKAQAPPAYMQVMSIFDTLFLTSVCMAANNLVSVATVKQLNQEGMSIQNIGLARDSKLRYLRLLFCKDAILSFVWKPAQAHFLLMIWAYMLAAYDSTVRSPGPCGTNYVAQGGVLLLCFCAAALAFSAPLELVNKGRTRLLLERLGSMAGVASILDWRGIGAIGVECAGNADKALHGMVVRFGEDISNDPQLHFGHLCLCPTRFCRTATDDRLYGGKYSQGDNHFNNTQVPHSQHSWQPPRADRVRAVIGDSPIQYARDTVLANCRQSGLVGIQAERLCRALATPDLSKLGRGGHLDDIVLGLGIEAAAWSSGKLTASGNRFRAIVLAAGTGKTTLVENSQGRYVDIDSLVPEHKKQTNYAAHKAWRLANLTAMARVHAWACMQEDEPPVLLCHGPTQLPPYFEWAAASLPQSDHQAHIKSRTLQHKRVSTLNYDYVSTLRPDPITIGDLTSWRSLVPQHLTWHDAPFTLLPGEGLHQVLNMAGTDSSEDERAAAGLLVIGGGQGLDNWNGLAECFAQYAASGNQPTDVNGSKVCVVTEAGKGYVEAKYMAFIAQNRAWASSPDGTDSGLAVGRPTARCFHFSQNASLTKALGLEMDEVNSLKLDGCLEREVSTRLGRLARFYLGIRHDVVASDAVMSMVDRDVDAACEEADLPVVTQGTADVWRPVIASAVLVADPPMVVKAGAGGQYLCLPTVLMGGPPILPHAQHSGTPTTAVGICAPIDRAMPAIMSFSLDPE